MAIDLLDVASACAKATERTIAALLKSIRQLQKGDERQKVAPNMVVAEIEKGTEKAELSILVRGKLLAAEILLLVSEKDALREKALRLLELAAVSCQTRFPYLEMAMNVLIHPTRTLGFSWQYVEEAISLDQIVHKFNQDTQFDTTATLPFLYEGHGIFQCLDGVSRISALNYGEEGVKSFDLLPDHLEVVMRNVRDERLKMSDRNNVAAVWAFAQKFIEAQRHYQRKRDVTGIVAGDKVDIKCVGFSEEDGPIFEVFGNEDLRGPLFNEEIIKGLYTEDLFPFFIINDVIHGAVFHQDDYQCTFSIRQAYETFAVNQARYNINNKRIIEAKALAVSKRANRINWITADGCGVNTYKYENVEEGDIRSLIILNIQRNKAGTFINAAEPLMEDYENDLLFDEDDESSVLEEFVYTKAQTAQPEERKEDFKPIVVLLGKILRNDATLSDENDSMAIFKRKLASILLFELAGETELAERAYSDAYYTYQLLSYAQGESVTVSNKIPLSPDNADVLFCLSKANEKDGYQQILRFMSEPDSLCGQIASLLTAKGVSYRFVDEVRADSESIREKICALLHVSDKFERQQKHSQGKYGKGETGTIEYKSSYVMRLDGKGPDIDFQGRGEVFKTVCCFLNKEGGTLFIGVNDSGNPIKAEGYGLSADIRWLCENYKSIDRQRFKQLNHHVQKADTIDHMAVFLNAEKELYFKDTLHELIIIEATEDNDAIRIRVQPSHYEIAYLYSDKTRKDGVAYIRDGNTTREMTRYEKEQRLMSLKHLSKDISFLVTIQEAIDKHQKLIFRGYSSGNSGKVSDRRVVPINLFYNDENVYAYDLDAKTEKQFRLSRIQSIDLITDAPIFTLPVTQPKKADVFRWISDKTYHVKLRMHVMARNYLLEEFSEAKNLPADEFYEEEPNIWILDTQLHGLGAVRRFYLGLADKIEILDTEDSDAIKEEIQKYLNIFLGVMANN